MTMIGDNVRRLRRPESAHASPGRRWKTKWPGEIDSSGGRVPCTVTDISSWGAQVSLEAVPGAEERVTINLDCIGAIPARVVWRRANVLGVQFLEQQSWIRRLHARRLDPGTWQVPAGEGRR
jgi:hypothetical protein